MDVRLERHLRESPLHAHGILELVRSIVSNNYYARAYRSTTIVGLPTGWTTAVLDAVTKDASGCFNLATGVWTAKASGIYRISYSINLYNTSGGAINAGGRVLLNGATAFCQKPYDGMPASGLMGMGIDQSDEREITVGDTLVVQYYVSSASCNLQGGAALTFLTVVRT